MVASVRERVSKRGETTYAVLFRHGGKQTSETFPGRREAEKFRQLVELIGPAEALARLNGTDSPAGYTLDDLAEKYLTWKASDVTDRTLADYRRDYEN